MTIKFRGSITSVEHSFYVLCRCLYQALQLNVSKIESQFALLLWSTVYVPQYYTCMLFKSI